MRYGNGIQASQIHDAVWVRSTYSGASGGNCVEVAALPGGGAAVRNSRDPEGTALIYPATAVRAMVSALRSGEFDYLVG